MINKLRLGYPVQTTDYRTNRTIRLREKPDEKALAECIRLAGLNLDDLESIIKVNEARGIRFYRISNDLFPHIANWRLITDRFDFKQLAYSMYTYSDKIKAIGKLANKLGHRLTFHASPYAILNTSNAFSLISTIRELWYYCTFFKLAGLPPESVVIVHGGGVYNDKQASIDVFVENFNSLLPEIKARLVIENDENRYNTEDVLHISELIKPYWIGDLHIKRIPVCFDYFHYCCYNIYRQKNPAKYARQKPISQLLPAIRATWIFRQKMHLSEQKKNSPIGTHSETIHEIPAELLGLDVDLMLESKNGDKTVVDILKNHISKDVNPR